MKTNAVRFATGLAPVAFGAPFPDSGQYFPPTLISVPPPAETYAHDEARPEGRRPTRPQPKGHYEGRTYLPD